MKHLVHAEIAKTTPDQERPRASRRAEDAFRFITPAWSDGARRPCQRILQSTDAEDAMPGGVSRAGASAVHSRYGILAGWLHRRCLAGRQQTVDATALPGDHEKARCRKARVMRARRYHVAQCGLIDEEVPLAKNFATPIILCYLEGRTQDEPRPMGWSVTNSAAD